ncbi:MAG: YceI family protein [Pyrinomonadaceae bacterium]
MKREYDFSKGVRGKFYRKGAELRLPIYLDPKLQEQLERLAEKKGKDVSEMVNQLVRKEVEAIEGEKGATHTVTGNLQLHGVTKSITFPATIVVSPGVMTVDSTFSVNRKDFGINYAGAADNLIRDEVVLTLHVRAVK